MKQGNRVFVVGLLIALVSACANTPVERQENTAQSLTELRDGLIATRSQIDITLASLNALMRAPEQNVKEAFRRYANDVDTITKQSANIDRESRDMRRRSGAWLSGWQRAHDQVKDPELRAISEGRRAQVVTRFETIDGSLAAARESFVPFIQSLQDVRKVVANDLTSRNLDAVANTAVVQNANANGATASRALDVAIADLQALLTSLAPAAPAKK